ncbi:MAG: hypothetical protein ACOYJ6_02750 [Caulobacterales bacterium]|jgi:hypothetical protein
MSSSDPVPIVTDLTFRISEHGDFFGLDFDCRDGSKRSAAFSIAVLTKMLAGSVWAGAEAGRRNNIPSLPETVRHALQDAAPPVTGFDMVETVTGPVLEIQIGAAIVCLRLSDTGLRALATALSDYTQTRRFPG